MTLPGRVLIAAVILSAAFSAQASSSQEPMQEVENVERRWMAAITDGDRAAYDSLLTEDFTWTFVSGRMISRDEMIATVGPVAVSETDKSIRVYEHSAIVTGIASLRVQGRPLTERFVRVWTRGADGQWRLAYFQATEIS